MRHCCFPDCYILLVPLQKDRIKAMQIFEKNCERGESNSCKYVGDHNIDPSKALCFAAKPVHILQRPVTVLVVYPPL
jgi:hypothetical protein